MKPCCVCLLIGTGVGMIAGCYLMLSNQKFKNFAKNSKKTIEQKVQQMQEDDQQQSDQQQ